MNQQWFLTILLSLSIVEYGRALATKRGGFPSIPNPFNSQQQVEPKLTIEGKGKLFLESLELESSYEPRAFYIDPKRFLDIATAIMPFITRFGSGSFAEGYRLSIGDRDDSRYTLAKIGNSKQIVESCSIDAPPTLNRGPIVLYEFEGCPFCRKVREAVSMLSLEVEFRPCPQGSLFRREIKDRYGQKSTFPFMRDPNTGIEMFESDDIIRYLFRTYSTGDIPSSLKSGIANTLTAGLGLLLRANRGGVGRSSDPPELPLTLWAGEGSPFSKLVKEQLCELQIAHVQIPCPRGSPHRERMLQKTGRFQIPYLEDPNTGVALYESSAIIEYLEAVYAIEKPDIKYM